MEQRNTRQRQMVLDAVQGRCDHPTADDIYLDVRQVDSHISRGTVYRNLGVLVETGQILRVSTSSADRYDLRLDRHSHVQCTQCGNVWDVPVDYAPSFDAKVEKLTGFQVQRHETLFEGVCPACQKKAKRAK